MSAPAKRTLKSKPDPATFTPLALPAPEEKKNLSEAVNPEIKLNAETPGVVATPTNTPIVNSPKMSSTTVATAPAPVSAPKPLHVSPEVAAKRKAEKEAEAKFNSENITITLQVVINKSVVEQTMATALKDAPYLSDYTKPSDAKDIFDSLWSHCARLSEADRWALLRLNKPNGGELALLTGQALITHAPEIARLHAMGNEDLEAKLKTALEADAKRKAEAEAKAEQDKMMADALAWRQLVADQEAKKAKRLASAPVASGGSVSSSERPKAKKRPEGISDAEWEADVARRERNAKNSKASEERKKALGIETKPLTAEEKAAQALMTPEERKAILVAKKAETRRLVKEAEARLNRAQ